VVGLLSRLQRESTEEGGVQDYGLTTARLYRTPLFCGLAAVGGVILVAMLPYAADVLTPEKGSAAGSSPSAKQVEQTETNVVPESATNVVPSTTTNAAAGPRTSATESEAASTNSSAITPAQSMETNAPSGGSASSSDKGKILEPLRPLTDIFDLKNNLMGLLVAAIFGLTPGLLFTELEQQGEKLKAAIKTSEPTQGASQK
jgi:hypothetical protein